MSANFAAVPQGSVVDLTAEGKVDWVHWGLYTDSSLTRKAGVMPGIRDFRVVDAETGYAFVYQYADNYNGYSWNDGYPFQSVTNTPTGVWAYGTPLVGSGFEFTALADTSTRVLKVYVGVYAGLGHFSAQLSDASAPGYTNATLMNIRNGPGRVYTIEYSANSANQSLIVRWTLASPRDPSGNVTMQAAALTASDANNPPVVTLNSPTNNAQFPSGASVDLRANANDLDGTVSRVEFWDGTNRLGQADASPYSISWNNAERGWHVLTASAADASGRVRHSVPIEIFVHGNGGALTGSMNVPPSYVNLTAEGTADWAHWGLVIPPGYDHKGGVTPQISDFMVVGTNGPVIYTNANSCGWTDGTPHLSESSTPTGIYVPGVTNGYEFAVPADTTPRQLRVYAGLYGAQGNFQAFLSDASAPAYTDTSLDTVYDTLHAVYAINYTAASPGQKLIVRCRTRAAYDMDYGNVAIQSVTLQGPAEFNLKILSATRAEGSFSLSVATDASHNYVGEYTDELSLSQWQAFTNFTGTGSIITVTDYNASANQRFYRVKQE